MIAMKNRRNPELIELMKHLVINHFSLSFSPHTHVVKMSKLLLVHNRTIRGGGGGRGEARKRERRGGGEEYICNIHHLNGSPTCKKPKKLLYRLIYIHIFFKKSTYLHRTIQTLHVTHAYLELIIPSRSHHACACRAS